MGNARGILPAGVQVMLDKIISGGQTGADQGGLLGASNRSYIDPVPTGGTAPPGFMTEAGPAPWLADKFGLVEGQADPKVYPKRTMKNIEDSDGTLLMGNKSSSGSKLTETLCYALKKPLIVNPSATELTTWLLHNPQIKVLNVAGNRESKNPGIQKRTAELISDTIYKLGALDNLVGVN